jgi:hypothetical protein
VLKLKQYNAGDALPLLEDDFLHAREYPTYESGINRLRRTHISKDGHAERSIHDSAYSARREAFHHHSLFVGPEDLARLSYLLDGASKENRARNADQAPDDSCRVLSFWESGVVRDLAVRDVDGVPEAAAPAFEAAWEAVIALFPAVPRLSRR